MRFAILIVFFVAGFARADKVYFPYGPAATQAREEVKIEFSVSTDAEVEVAVLDAKGKVIRLVLRGKLSGDSPYPERRGCFQELYWDGKDAVAKTASGGPFRVRVRAGLRADGTWTAEKTFAIDVGQRDRDGR